MHFHPLFQEKPMLTPAPVCWKRRLLLLALVGIVSLTALTTAEAALRRHYYTGWTYYPAQTYYYSYYYYQPQVNYTGYKYHYCVYNTVQPNYVYYYNPYLQQYWGRYDLEAKGYSLLAAADRKERLKDIPESAFPKPAAMPPIPESKDGELMLPPDPATLPGTKDPKDAPK